MNEARRITKDLLDHARADYEIRQLGDLFKEVEQALNDPGLIQDKETAVSVCHALIRNSIERGAMAKDSIMHKMGLRLLDYIERNEA